MSGVEAMVSAAIATIGAHETNGDNTNFITHWYGLDGQPWCDQAVTYWAYHSDNQNSVVFGGKFAYTVAHAQAFKEHGEWYGISNDVSGMRRGDVVFFDWAGTSNNIAAIDHVGLVESVDGQNVHTIEGNISNECKRMLRTHAVITGYGRPAYVNPKPVPVPPKPVPVPVRVLPWISFKQVVAAANSHSGVVGTPNTPSSSADDVAHVQDALVKLDLCDFGGRGVFGSLTHAGYMKWQQHLGFSGAGADGIPGQTSLVKLGQGSNLFQVRDF